MKREGAQGAGASTAAAMRGWQRGIVRPGGDMRRSAVFAAFAAEASIGAWPVSNFTSCPARYGLRAGAYAKKVWPLTGHAFGGETIRCRFRKRRGKSARAGARGSRRPPPAYQGVVVAEAPPLALVLLLAFRVEALGSFSSLLT